MLYVSRREDSYVWGCSNESHRRSVRFLPWPSVTSPGAIFTWVVRCTGDPKWYSCVNRPNDERSKVSDGRDYGLRQEDNCSTPVSLDWLQVTQIFVTGTVEYRPVHRGGGTLGRHDPLGLRDSGAKLRRSRGPQDWGCPQSGSQVYPQWVVSVKSL